MEISRWSPTAAENNAAVPDGAPEGWTGSQVNNWGRETMAQLYAWYEYPEWIEITYRLAAAGVKTLAKLTDSSFRIASCDARTTVSGKTAYAVGRRCRLVQGATTYDGWITAVAFTAGNTDVTIDLDSGVVPATIDNTYLHVVATLKRVAFLATGSSDQVLTTTDGVEPSWGTAPVPRGYLFGCTLSRTATVDITIAAGAARSSDNTKSITLAATLVKKIDSAWTAGSAVGGRSGALANATWYHVFLILNPTTGVVDAGFDTSLTATNLLAAAAGYTKYRRIGSVYYIDGASFLRDFVQLKDTFYWKSPPLDVNTTTLGTSATLYALSGVPLGVSVLAFMNVGIDHGSSDVNVYLSPPGATDLASSETAAPLATISKNGDAAYAITTVSGIATDASAQVRARSSDSSTTLRIATLGWRDPLGE